LVSAVKLPWRKADREQATADEAESALEHEVIPGEAEQGAEPRRAVADETTARAAIEASEWVREYSQKIADDAQRAIAELHQKIAESAERAMADFGGRSSAPDASAEEAPTPDEGPPSSENREDQET
jgi:hypothetical protein